MQRQALRQKSSQAKGLPGLSRVTMTRLKTLKHPKGSYVNNNIDRGLRSRMPFGIVAKLNPRRSKACVLQRAEGVLKDSALESDLSGARVRSAPLRPRLRSCRGRDGRPIKERESLCSGLSLSFQIPLRRGRRRDSTSSGQSLGLHFGWMRSRVAASGRTAAGA